MGSPYREAQLQKVPFMLVVGVREAADGTVAVRSRTGGDEGAREVAAFVRAAREAIAARSGSAS
jgi:threonyl-tRNA synthetase